MEVVIIALVIIVGIGWWIWSESQREKNGHPLEGATKNAAVAPVLTQALDVNKDGKVDLKDVKAAATKATKAVKTTATKAKTAVKKTVAKKAPAKKTAAKKTKK